LTKTPCPASAWARVEGPDLSENGAAISSSCPKTAESNKPRICSVTRAAMALSLLCPDENRSTFSSDAAMPLCMCLNWSLPMSIGTPLLPASSTSILR